MALYKFRIIIITSTMAAVSAVDENDFLAVTLWRRQDAVTRWMIESCETVTITFSSNCVKWHLYARFSPVKPVIVLITGLR